MKRCRCAAAACLALVLATAAFHARAEDLVDARSLEAERLAAEAHARYEAGAYGQAVELYLRANEQSPAAVFLYDVAILHDRHLHAPAAALAYYRKALAAPDLDPALATRTRARILELERAPPPKDAPSAASPSTVRVPSPLRPWSFVVGGVGLAAIGVGAYFGLRARANDADASAYCTGDRCTDPRALVLTNDAVSAARIANVAFVGGAVLLAAGVVLYLLSPAKRVAVSAAGLSIPMGSASP